MTVYGWDGSHWDRDGGINPTEAEFRSLGFMIWRAGIGGKIDLTFAWAWGKAQQYQIPFALYWFPLETHHSNGTSPPASAAQQLAALQRACPDTSVPVMFDWEANQNQDTGQIYNAPTFDDVLRVAEAFRGAGYFCPLLYTGDYWWQEQGSPTLDGHGFDLVNAHYESDAIGTAAVRYNVQGGDTGVGWKGFGGLEPIAWQFGSRIRFAGKLVDMNAIRAQDSLAYWFKTDYGDAVSAPRTKVTVPTFLKDKPNGKLDPAWLRSPDAHTSDVWKMFEPVSYAMQAFILAAAAAGHTLASTGRYRTYQRQVELFNGEKYPTVGRYKRNPDCGCGAKSWDSDGHGSRETWYLQRGTKGGCFAMAATPGSSNHGLGLADDMTWDTTEAFKWLDANQTAFGLGLETPAEQWHRHWVGGDKLNQLVVDTLYAHGITVPDQSKYGFFVPDPTQSPDPPKPPKEDDMAVFLAYTDTTATGGVKQLWRGNLVEAYSLGDPNVSGTDAYGLVRRNFTTDVRVKGVYTNPNTRKVYESADEIVTISPNQIRLDLGTPRSPVT